MAHATRALPGCWRCCLRALLFACLAGPPLLRTWQPWEAFASRSASLAAHAGRRPRCFLRSQCLADRSLDQIADDVELLLAELEEMRPLGSARSPTAPPRLVEREAYALGGRSPAPAEHRAHVQVIEAEVVAPYRQEDVGGSYRGPPASRQPPEAALEEVRLQNLLQAEAREKESLLEEQRQQHLELEDLRRRQQELQLLQEANDAESAKQSQPLVQTSMDDVQAAEAPSREGLMNAIRITGVRTAPEYGGDMFVASFPQIGKLVRLQMEKAKRAHLAGMQALRRYVVQLETDLDSKDEEVSAAAVRLEEEKTLRFKAEEAALQALSQPPVAFAPSPSTAAESASVAAAEGEVARLQEELLAARQGAEAAQAELAQEAQRAEAAETKLRALVERIRGASSKR